MSASIPKHPDFSPPDYCPPPIPSKTCKVSKIISSKKNPARKRSATKVPNIKKPKRYLSVYNIFFKEERERIIARAKTNNDQKEGTGCSVSEEEIDTLDYRPKRGRPRGPNYMKKTPHYAIGFDKLAQIVSSRWPSAKDEYFEKYGAEVEKDKMRYEKEMEEYKKLVKEANIKQRKSKTNNNPSIESQPLNSIKYGEAVGSFKINNHNNTDIQDNRTSYSHLHNYHQSEYSTKNDSIANSHFHYSVNSHSNHRLESSENDCGQHYENKNYANFHPPVNTYKANEFYSHLHSMEDPNVRAIDRPSTYYEERSSSNCIHNNYVNSYCQRHPENESQIYSKQLGTRSRISGNLTPMPYNSYSHSNYANFHPPVNTYKANEFYSHLHSMEDPNVRAIDRPSTYNEERTSSNRFHNNYVNSYCQRHPENESQIYSNQLGTRSRISENLTPMPYNSYSHSNYSSDFKEEKGNKDK